MKHNMNLIYFREYFESGRSYLARVGVVAEAEIEAFGDME